MHAPPGPQNLYRIHAPTWGSCLARAGEIVPSLDDRTHLCRGVLACPGGLAATAVLPRVPPLLPFPAGAGTGGRPARPELPPADAEAPSLDCESRFTARARPCTLGENSCFAPVQVLSS